MRFKSWLNEVKYSDVMGLDVQEIKGFLGKSVVRRPVYHGTDEKFDKFELRPSQRFILFTAFDVQAQGFFFTEKLAAAKSYGRRVITAYVRLENPLLNPREFPHMGVDRLPRQKEIHLAYILRNMFEKDQHGRAMDIGIGRHWIDDDFAKRKDYSWVYNAVNSGGLAWDALDNPGVAASMKKLGYDGTFVHEDNSPDTDRSVFVMSPNQIKIVDVRQY